jgi:SAM-dependent methyltransferase
LTAGDFDQQLTTSNRHFDFVFAFAVLHHIPGRAQQLRLMQQVGGLLPKDGRFIQSNWQFLNSLRLRKRIRPWAEVGLAVEEVDEGDYLLDWRRDGGGLRYAHHFSEAELAKLAREAGFGAVESFYSDGFEGNLAIYQIWEKTGF